ncbi:hypothetical protein [Burkholderia sp. BCC0397]|uniref:hypothetical protein n=1 Tax=Burkholderia sp. BCC0397 TaxID=486876 RepID=UPI00158B4231|nr:hypothetical protein [Burkholderia sp. BCC0397]
MACDPQSGWTTAIQVGAAALGPIIALVGGWIAWQQVRISRNKLKLDRFDKRFEVYEAAMTFVSRIAAKDAVEEKWVNEFLLATRRARFLISPEIEQYLRALRRKAGELQLVHKALQGPPIPSDHERARLADKWGEIHQAL